MALGPGSKIRVRDDVMLSIRGRTGTIERATTLCADNRPSFIVNLDGDRTRGGWTLYAEEVEADEGEK